MGSRKSGWIDNTEAMRWTPTQLAQVLAEVHYAVASRSDQLSMYNHPIFVATRANLRLGIEVAYPREFATWGPSLIEAAYSIWVNSGEPIAHCVASAVDYLTDRVNMATEAAARCTVCSDPRPHTHTGYHGMPIHTSEADASRAATPGAHSESAGIPTTQDQPTSDPWAHAAPLNHERKRTDR